MHATSRAKTACSPTAAHSTPQALSRMTRPEAEPHHANLEPCDPIVMDGTFEEAQAMRGLFHNADVDGRNAFNSSFRPCPSLALENCPLSESSFCHRPDDSPCHITINIVARSICLETPVSEKGWSHPLQTRVWKSTTAALIWPMMHLDHKTAGQASS
jgi:hypothetical protein